MALDYIIETLKTDDSLRDKVQSDIETLFLRLKPQLKILLTKSIKERLGENWLRDRIRELMMRELGQEVKLVRDKYLTNISSITRKFMASKGFDV